MKILRTLVLISLILSLKTVVGQNVFSKVLWEKGTGLYNNYRIPSLFVTQKGTVLAFCEGREGGDSGDINLLVKRSNDNGKSWSKEQIIWDDKQNTCGNPCPVTDEKTGRIYLFMTWNLETDTGKEMKQNISEDTRRPYVCYSDDDGNTWSPPKELTAICKDPGWGWYATGPGVGIQIKKGKYKGRLIIPANHTYLDTASNPENTTYVGGAHILFSDDHGETWQMSEPIKSRLSESQVVELSNGSLMMNMRSINGKYCRASAVSHDGGKTWSDIKHEFQLAESVCQGSFIGYGAYKGRDMFLFSNPAVPVGRTHMTIRASFDDCSTWIISKLITPYPSAYSCLTRLPDGNIGILFEVGKKFRYQTITFLSFPPEALFSEAYLMEY